jgi:ArsR family transcriptional regulator
MDEKQIEKISKALGDTNRLKILFDMAKQKGCKSCSEINSELNLAQPSVSHHIKTLIDAGLITTEKDGRFHSYQINKQNFKAYLKKLSSITGE